MTSPEQEIAFTQNKIQIHYHYSRKSLEQIKHKHYTARNVLNEFLIPTGRTKTFTLVFENLYFCIEHFENNLLVTPNRCNNSIIIFARES